MEIMIGVLFSTVGLYLMWSAIPKKKVKKKIKVKSKVVEPTVNKHQM